MTNHPNRAKQQQAKHTPGPWDYVTGRTLHHVETRHDHPDGAGIAICSIPLAREANARLIAAAPELLAALNAIKEAGRMSDQSRAKYCAEIAETAIAKAEGR